MRTNQMQRSSRVLLKLRPLEAKTLVDQVVDSIVEATATGIFLPGDRIVEAEVARSLNVSRVPVREALRMLESQGIVVNERYRGMRLMDVNIDRLEKILKVRLVLENLAGREIMVLLKHDPKLLDPLEALLGKMHGLADDGNAFGVASLDTDFHHCFCELSGNKVLVQTWEPLSRQLTIIFGLSTLKKKLVDIVAEHDEFIDILRQGNIEAFEKMMDIHILEYSRDIDYEGLVKHLRELEQRPK
ncbi:MAG: GntR family transcriptional regulator [Alphaproteobacteria bacterium]